ncbi:MAG: proline dehydrogenase family protein [Crocinitomicaceae bacterium]|nr:proline dehydrogenase family protein [Crocinitomicaceae bacterium]
MISFENTEVAFKSKSTKDLKRAYWLFKVVANPRAVAFGKWATNFAIKTHLPIKGIIKATIFKQFCGGESIMESLKTSNQLAKYGVMTILDYSIEGKTEEEDFDRTVQEIIDTITQGKSNDNIPFAVFKVTGICLFETLEKVNDGIENLDIETQTKYNKLVERVDQICKAAFEADVPVFIDAEETWIQDSIDRLAKEMSLRYNKKRAIVFNTIQLYRHDRLAFLNTEIEHAKSFNYFLGVKLVRGAYMEKERDRAKEMGYPSPIQPNKAASDKDYDRAVETVLDNLDITSACVGTHNEESSAKLAQLMVDKGIDKNDKRLYFAQLLGMSDHISYNLAYHEYNVAKYVPYGPIQEVLPYLLRRADENTSVAGQTTRELSLIIKERNRRKSK